MQPQAYIRFITGLIFLFFMTTVQSGSPLWIFDPISNFPPQVTINALGSATIKYRITNQSHKNHQVVMSPIKGITATGCMETLGSRQSCVLTLVVQGSALAGSIKGGPNLCARGNPNLCFHPNIQNSLNITLIPSTDPVLSPVALASGQYNDGITYRPLLIVSNDNGQNWNYPSAIPAVTFTPNNITNPFSSMGNLNLSNCLGETCTVVGDYYDPLNIERPLLTISTDAGKTWSYPSVINEVTLTPDNITHPFTTNGYFSASAATSTLMFAIGGYSTGGTSRPLLAMSQDQGVSWSYPSIISEVHFTPDNISHAFVANGALNSASCNSTLCIAVGNYSDGITSRPLLVFTKDSGQTWIYPSSINEVVFTPDNITYPFVRNGYFLNSSCSDSLCLSVGYYSDNISIRPLIALSRDFGVTWTYPSSVTNPVFTPDNISYPYTNNAQFASSSCSGALCIAGGYYDDGSSNRPIIAITEDSGTTWSFPSTINNVIFSPDNITHPYQGQGAIVATSCSDKICVGVGYYSDGITQRPLLVQSQDSGATWVYPSDINKVIFTPDNISHPFVDNGYFQGVYCSGITCIASGSYGDGGTNRPLVAVTNDLGVTWTFPSEVNQVILSPDNISNPFISDARLNGGANNGGLIYLPDSLPCLGVW